MRPPAAALLLAAVCTAETRYLEIELSPGIVPERVFIRYRLDDDDLGGWVQPRPGVSSYWISAMREGRAATRIGALLYAPGCDPNPRSSAIWRDQPEVLADLPPAGRSPSLDSILK